MVGWMRWMPHVKQVLFPGGTSLSYSVCLFCLQWNDRPQVWPHLAPPTPFWSPFATEQSPACDTVRFIKIAAQASKRLPQQAGGVCKWLMLGLTKTERLRGGGGGL